MNHSTRAIIIAILCLLGVSVMEYRVITMIQAKNFHGQMEVAVGILDGHPYWKAFQNRILGPEIVYGAYSLTHIPFPICYEAFSFLMICLSNVVCYFLFWRHGKNQNLAWAYTLSYIALILAFQDPGWIYLWDYIDFTVMLLFAWAVVIRRLPLWQITVLFIAELLNRESAQFIALWIIIDSVQIEVGANQGRKLNIDFGRLMTGVTLFAVGAIWTNFIRAQLYIKQTGTVPWPEVHEVAGQLFMFPIILKLLRQTPYSTVVTFLMFFGVLAYYCYECRHLPDQRAWKIPLFICAPVVANFCFAHVFEMRVWFTLLPFLLCLIYLKNVVPARVLANVKS